MLIEQINDDDELRSYFDFRTSLVNPL